MKLVSNKVIPVILDTDIGGDIDDIWALALALKSPELDLRLVATDTGDTSYRARVAARMLEVAGRARVPVGIGIPFDGHPAPQQPWVADYDLSAYPGRVYKDGVGAIIETIMGSPEPVTLICIGPVPNIAAALEREPRIAQRARFVGMQGSLRRGYGGSDQVHPEYNVYADPGAFRKVLEAPWDITITPLDTCGIVRLEGEKYRAVRDCPDILAQALIENYRIWSENAPWEWARQFDPGTGSTVLYDTVAVFLAFSEQYLEIEKLGVSVTDDGYTRIDDRARAVNCATAWKDLKAFEDLLVDRLTGKRG
jgi:inosine-uridine nucleoside N-ribohydrolase